MSAPGEQSADQAGALAEAALIFTSASSASICSSIRGSATASGRRGRSLTQLPPPALCKRNIEMTPLCKIEVTHPRVLGSREVRRGGVVDEQAGVQPS